MGSVWWDQFLRRMWERFAIKKAWARSVADADETPYKEELELLRHSIDLRFGSLLMRQAYNAGKSGDWANYLEQIIELSVWTSAKVRECNSEVLFHRKKFERFRVVFGINQQIRIRILSSRKFF